KLKETVRVGVRIQDNVIDATPYFLEENKKQALGERRIGLGVMGLHDLLIYSETEYGSKEGNDLVDKIFEVIATTAYRESIQLAQENEGITFLVGDTEEETKQHREGFIKSGCMTNSSVPIRNDVLHYGLRNSPLLTVETAGSTG